MRDIIEVKICGIVDPSAMTAALDAGADYVGLVFFGKSPRNVDLETAHGLADMARGRAKVVALVVDADDRLLDAITAKVAPDVFQLHGAETPERAAAVASRLQRATVKALAVETAHDIAKANAYLGADQTLDGAPFVLFDAKAPADANLPGGNGVAFDWRILREAAADIPYMLAGGLTPDNVADAIQVTGADRVDVSSGVESAPGIKDPALIRSFIHAVKTAKQAA